jgi:hypothetical protein
MIDGIVIASPAISAEPIAEPVAEAPATVESAPPPEEVIRGMGYRALSPSFVSGLETKYPDLWRNDKFVEVLYDTILYWQSSTWSKAMLSRRPDVLDRFIISKPGEVARHLDLMELQTLSPEAVAAVLGVMASITELDAPDVIEFLDKFMSPEVDQSALLKVFSDTETAYAMVELIAEKGVPRWMSPLVKQKLGGMLRKQVQNGTPLSWIKQAGTLENMLTALGVKLTQAEEKALLDAYGREISSSESEFDVVRGMMKLCSGKLGKMAFKQAANQLDKTRAWPVFFAVDDADEDFVLDAMINSWTSDSRLPASQVAQIVALEQLPGPEKSGLYFPDKVGYSAGPAGYLNESVLKEVSSEKAMDVTRKAVARVYWRTQEQLEKDGLSVIRLYRGVAKEVGMPSALESWTTDQDVASFFDGHEVLEANVPASAVFVCHTTPGLSDAFLETENEYVVIASRVPPGAYVAPRRASLVVSPTLSRFSAAAAPKAPKTVDELQSMPQEHWGNDGMVSGAFENVLSSAPDDWANASTSQDAARGLLDRRVDILSKLLKAKPWLAHDSPQAVPFGNLSDDVIHEVARLAVERGACDVLDNIAERNPAAIPTVLKAVGAAEPLSLVKTFAFHMERQTCKLFYSKEVADAARRAMLTVFSSTAMAQDMERYLLGLSQSLEDFLVRLGMDQQMERALVDFHQETGFQEMRGVVNVEGAFTKMCGGEIGRRAFVEKARKLPKAQAKQGFFVRDDFSPDEVKDIMLQTWVANSRMSAGQAVQVVAKDMWKGEPTGIYFPPYVPREIKPETVAKMTTPAAAKSIGAALDGLYKRTQATIRDVVEYDPNAKYDAGMETIRLYRGLESEVNIPSVFDSWTSDKFTAKEQFDGWETIVADVPVKAILVSYLSDDWAELGAGESEYIVIRALMPDSSIRKRIPGPDKKQPGKLAPSRWTNE